MGPYRNDKKVFGQTMKKSTASSSRYRRQFGSTGGGDRNHSRVAPTEHSPPPATNADTKAAEAAARRRVRQDQGEAIDARFGFHRLEDQHVQAQQRGGPDAPSGRAARRGWLFHMLATTVRAILFVSRSGTLNT
jgi:hypothetical protein